ncbi:RNA-binding KH domain-containing protein, putative isoform 2 [Hibiscus syriacus]|uniref:RNA-binding KH domain-containing protein, putative isoform 2 n=1 Tax=Hibiscus syriacus TaxID=106335 RepID=A0A6A3BU17_HIBSY|nr:RNA-binding KH domain-containing protein, putative isoform 2 [Hibiscus syriacus]
MMHYIHINKGGKNILILKISYIITEDFISRNLCVMPNYLFLQFIEDPSPTINAAMCLQSRGSEKTETESGDYVITTRLLVPSSQVGCLIGKGGAIVSGMRSATRASIRILSKENLPKVAYEDEEMVQIIGSLDVASNAFSQVLLRLRANIFEREGAASTFLPALPYIPMSLDISDGPKFGNKDGQLHNHLYSSYMGGYSPSDLSASDNKGTYSGGDIYRNHGGRNSGRGLSSVNQVSHRKHGY